MNPPHMLVTGGSGYLGDWVVRLARQAWEVETTFFTHLGTAPGMTYHRLDLRDADATRRLVAQLQPDVIVHTAANNPGPRPDFQGVNVHGTRHIAQAAVEQGCRLLHLSTDVVFDGEQGHYVETDPPHAVTAYGRSKSQAEMAIHQSGAEALIVRTSLIYGWRPEVDRQTHWILESLRAGNPPRLFTDELRCPIWVETLAAALVELAERRLTGILHVAGAQPLSRYDFGVRLARFHGVDPAPIHAARSRASGLQRPLDCTLDCSRAQALLRTPLPGVDEVLRAHDPANPLTNAPPQV